MAFDAGSASGIASGAGGLLSSVSTMMLANQQKNRSKELRANAGKVPLTPVQQEYIDAMKKAQLATTGDMPGYENAKENIQAGVPNMVRIAQMSAKDNADILAGALNAQTATNKGLNDLATSDAAYKNQESKYADTLALSVAEQKNNNLALQRAEKLKLETAAGNLENAATANKQKGITSAITSIASMFGAGFLGSAAGNISNSQADATGNKGYTTPDATLDAQKANTNPSYNTPITTNPTEQVDNQNEALRLNQLPNGTNPTDNTQFGTPLQMPDLNKDYASASQQEVQQLQAYLKSKGYQINPTGTLDNQTIQALQDHKQGLQKFAMFGNNYTE